MMATATDVDDQEDWVYDDDDDGAWPSGYDDIYYGDDAVTEQAKVDAQSDFICGATGCSRIPTRISDDRDGTPEIRFCADHAMGHTIPLRTVR